MRIIILFLFPLMAWATDDKVTVPDQFQAQDQHQNQGQEQTQSQIQSANADANASNGGVQFDYPDLIGRIGGTAIAPDPANITAPCVRPVDGPKGVPRAYIGVHARGARMVVDERCMALLERQVALQEKQLEFQQKQLEAENKLVKCQTDLARAETDVSNCERDVKY